MARKDQVHQPESVQSMGQSMLRRLLQDRRARRVTAALGCVVLAVTVWRLTRPAVTWEAEAFCGETEHVHSESCFETVLGCGLEEHAHTEECYEEGFVCGLEEHTHTDACFEEVETLICGTPEHTHTDACFEETETLVCTLNEHVHGADCYDEEGNLSCEEEEHRHGEACFETERTLVCDEEEHAHIDACFELTEQCTCGLEEHEHDESCRGQILSCGMEEHTHTEDCYTEKAVCGFEGHTHSLACYSDPGADTDGSYWRAQVPETGGDWRTDLLRTAASQIGYTESKKNYAVLSDGKTMKGYTIYGSFCGVPYGDWCAAFVSWCLEAAGVDYPTEVSCTRWAKALTRAGLYLEADEYLPSPGDLVFFDYEQDGTIDHVGIAAAAEYDDTATLSRLTTIEGNSANAVRSVKYEGTDLRAIAGFGLLPERDEATGLAKNHDRFTLADEPEAEAAPPQVSLVENPVLRFEGGAAGIRVTVEADADAFPTEVTMMVRKIRAERILDAVSGAVAEATEAEIKDVEAVDISFYDDEDEEVEPLKPIRVTMRSEKVLDAAAPMVVHVDNRGDAALVEQAAEEILPEPKDDDAVVFEVDSFSVYAIVYTVDFAWEVGGSQYTFTLAGDDAVSLRALAAALHLYETPEADAAAGAADAESAAFKSTEAEADSESAAEEAAAADGAQADEAESAGDENAAEEPAAEEIAAESAEADAPAEEGGESTGASAPAEEAGGEVRSVTAGDVLRAEASERENEKLDAFMAAVESVSFSDPSLVRVIAIDEAQSLLTLKLKNGFWQTGDLWKAEDVIRSANARVFDAGDWAIVSLAPFNTLETLTITLKGGEEITVDVTDAQDAPMNGDGTVDTITNPAGTTIDLFDYWVSDSLRDEFARRAWPGFKDKNGGEDYGGGSSGVNLDWDSFLRGTGGNNAGINARADDPDHGHALKFSPAFSHTVVDGTINNWGQETNDGWTESGTNWSDVTRGLNSYTMNANPLQGLVQGTLDAYGYPILTTDASLGTNGESLRYLFDPGYAHAGKQSYTGADHLLYVDPDGYYTYDSRDYSATYNAGTQRFELREQDGSDPGYGFNENEKRGYWPFGDRNYWHGMHLSADFSMPYNGQVLNPKGVYKDMQFEFSGDDDVWLYVDGVLLGDAGGIHNRTGIHINFATGTVKVTGKDDPLHADEPDASDSANARFHLWEKTLYLDDLYRAAGKYDENAWEEGGADGHMRFKANTYHHFDMFYLERGGGESNLYIHYNLVSTVEFTAHKSFAGINRLERDQFRFELVGLDGQYKRCADQSNPPDSAIRDKDGVWWYCADKNAHAIMPQGSSGGAGTVGSPYSEHIDAAGGEPGYTSFITGVTEDGNVNFGNADIPSAEQDACNAGAPSSYLYQVREVVPEDAENEDGVLWRDATPEQRAAGGFMKDHVRYDGRVYYWMGTVRAEEVTNGDGSTRTVYNLSKSRYLDAAYSEPDTETRFFNFNNEFVPGGGSVSFTKVDGSNSPLPGAEFTLYTSAACSEVAKDLDGVEQKNIASGADGTVTFENMAAPETYYMRETKTPAGFEPNDTIYKVVIEDRLDKAKTSVITVNGDASDTPVSRIINTRPGEISVQKRWVDESGNELSGGGREVTVQLRRYHYVAEGGSDAAHTVTVVFSGYDYSGNYFSESKSAAVAGDSAEIRWIVDGGADGSVFSGQDGTTWQDSPAATIFYKTISPLTSDVTVNVTVNEYWVIQNGKFAYEDTQISGAVDLTLVPDTSFPAASDTSATQVLNASNHFAHTWTIGNESGKDFPATDGSNPYLYYLVELKPDGTEAVVGEELSGGAIFRGITYEPALGEAPGLQSGLVTVTNELPPAAPITLTVRKVHKFEVNTESTATLPGATFRLEKYTDADFRTKDSTWEEITLSDTAGTGVFSFEGLTAGYYKLVETNTPPGFIKATADPTFTVRTNAETGALEILHSDTAMAVYTPAGVLRVGNEPGTALPSTGGAGTQIFALLGGSVMLLAAGALLLKKRRT